MTKYSDNFEEEVRKIKSETILYYTLNLLSQRGSSVADLETSSEMYCLSLYSLISARRSSWREEVSCAEKSRVRMEAAKLAQRKGFSPKCSLEYSSFCGLARVRSGHALQRMQSCTVPNQLWDSAARQIWNWFVGQLHPLRGIDDVKELCRIQIPVHIPT